MSNTQKKNVPELRFPGFEGEWEEKKLGDLTTKIGSGKTPKGGSENYTNKGIPFLRSQNIRNGKLNLNDLVYISKDIDDEMKNSRTYYGDVLLNITGASIGRTAINSIVETYANLNQHVCIIRLKKEYYYNFFGQYLLSRKGKRKIFLAQSGGSREGLNFKEIANLKIFTPTIFEEQQKIGKFFSKLDRQIELEEQKLELLQQQKKGYMQKIFSQELRFKDENGNDYPEWEEKQLGDTLEFIKDGTHGTHENVDNGPWLLSAKNIKNNKIIISSDDRKISENEYKKIYKNYKLERGDLLLTIVGTIGRTAIVKDPNSIAFQRSVAILKTKALYDVGFIFQLFQTNYFKNLLLRKQVVSAQPGLYLGDIRKLKISISNISEEQKKIGSFFSKFDRQIELEQQKLELLQQLKKGLLQSMFI
ncbi:restriction endonuclease subunit S [Staphylococcus aureus]|nr:restriction endonuclease subunit S [Staphylococcus aureus]UVJ25581.1 restriction endonuclease subunit S [Staphylococcus aureus]